MREIIRSLRFLFTACLILSSYHNLYSQDNLDIRNVVKLFQCWEYPSDLEISNGMAYVAGGYAGLIIFDISDPDQPQWINAFDPIGGRVQCVEIRNDIAFINHCGSVIILDVFDPDNPVEISQTQVVPDNQAYNIDMALSGDCLIFSESFGANYILDISNLENPQVIGSLSREFEMTDGIRIECEGNIAYVLVDVTSNMGGFYLLSMDVLNPAAPSSLDNIFLMRTRITDYKISGDFVYLAVSDPDSSWLYSVNKADPTNLQIASRHPLAQSPAAITLIGEPNELECAVCSSTNGMLVLDVTDPDDIALLHVIDLPNPLGGLLINDSEDTIVLANEDLGLQIFTYDIDMFPDFISSIYQRTESKKLACNAAIAVVSGFSGGVKLADFDDINRPVEAGEIICDDRSSIFLTSNRLYSFNRLTSRLQTFSIESLDSVALIGDWQPEIRSDGACLWDETMILSSNNAGLELYSVANPNAPELLSSLPEQNRFEFSSRQGNFIYYISQRTLNVLDIADLNNPDLVFTTELEHFQYLPEIISAEQECLAIASSHCLNIFSLEDPDNPVLQCVIDTLDWAKSLAIAGDRFAYLDKYLRVFDISNLEIPEQIACYSLPGSPEQVLINEAGQFLVADLTNFGVYELYDTLSVICDGIRVQPDCFSLSSPFPNPFNSTTTIGYSLPAAGMVSLAVYNLAGREVTRLVDGVKPAGTHEVVWTADGVASGVYVVKLAAGEKTAMSKVVLVR